MSFSPPTSDPSSDGFGKQASNTFNTFLIIVVVVSIAGVAGTVLTAYLIYKCVRKSGLPSININTHTAAAAPSAVTPLYTTVADSQIKLVTVENFLNDLAREKPIRFTAQQLAGFTQNYATRLGAGGFGAVYEGRLPNGVPVAVKVLHGSLDKRAEEQFMAEVGTIGRTYHINLVRLFGFCFDAQVKALVYEYMCNGALDKHLFDRTRQMSVVMRHAIAVGTAKGLRYLHEECQQKIIHYDIKPGNILLDGKLQPKVADFGLAKLLSRDDTHISNTGMRGTPGYAAPEMWMVTAVTEKCDVYSFGMLLFEIIGRRRNFQDNMTESQHWFPQMVWTRYERGELQEITSVSEIAEGDAKEKMERMCKVALWCVQHQAEARPPMSTVVKMLEGEMAVAPPLNPFQHLMAPAAAANLWSATSENSRSSASQARDAIIVTV